MQHILHCIALRVVKHNDNMSIVSAWSRERGCVAIALSMSSGREAKRRRALMMPLSLFEGVADIKPGQEILHIKDVRPYLYGNVTASDPVRSVVALFLSDFLYAVLRGGQPDALLTDFIFESCGLLATLSGGALANFHLYFTYKLGQFLGISPDIGTYSAGRYFDMREGIFTVTAPVHSAYLDAQGASMVMLLSRLNPRNLHLPRLSRQQRNQILDSIIEYYTLHHSAINLRQSLEVVRALFV